MESKQQLCSEVQNLLPLYVGADLDPAEMDLVADHLNECSVCRDGNLDMLGVRARLALLDEAEWSQRSPEFWPGVRSRLVDEGLIQTSESELAVPAHPSWMQRLRAGGWAAAAALVVSFSALQFMEPAAPEGGGSRIVQEGAREASSREPLVLPSPSQGQPRMSVSPVSTGGLPKSAPAVSTPIRTPGVASPLRRATQEDVHLLDSARPVGLNGLTPRGAAGQREP